MEDQSNLKHLTILAHAVELNAVAIEEAISWCDQQIAKIDKPDYWLIELSISRKHPIDIVNQLKNAGAKTPIKDSIYLSLVAGAFFRERIDYIRATQLLFDRFCSEEWEVMTDLRQEIFRIDHELDWNIPEGIKRLKSLLENYKAQFYNLLTEIGINA